MAATWRGMRKTVVNGYDWMPVELEYMTGCRLYLNDMLKHVPDDQADCRAMMAQLIAMDRGIA